MTTVIHQPYFLPWLGYFAKLVYADKFIVLDNVYFSKRKFIDRVKIINAQGKEMWIGLPVGENFNKPCNKIQFSDKNAINKIIKNFYASYSKARHFKDNIAQIENILNNCFDNSDLLSEINMNIIEKIMQLLDLKIPEIIFSSQFEEINDATERVIITLHLIFSTFIEKDIYKKFGNIEQNIINSVGCILQKFENTNQTNEYIATRIATAKKCVYDFNWQDDTSTEKKRDYNPNGYVNPVDKKFSPTSSPIHISLPCALIILTLSLNDHVLKIHGFK
jgi:hypothetical protein